MARRAGSSRTTRRAPSRRARPGRRRSRPLTPSPISSTHAAPSCPMTTPAGRSHSPSTTWRSEWHTPAAAIRTRTSPRCGGSSVSSSIRGCVPGPRKTTPRVLIGWPSTRPILAPGCRKAGHTARPSGWCESRRLLSDLDHDLHHRSERRSRRWLPAARPESSVPCWPSCRSVLGTYML